MTSKKVAESVLDKIKQENIKQWPKWYFVTRNILFWAAFSVSAIIGARVIGVVMFAFTQFDFTMIARSKGGFLIPMLKVFPYLWIIFFLIFIIFAILGLQRTSNGYKLSTTKLIGLNVLISLVLGILFLGIGDAKKFENRMAKRLPFYSGIEQQRGELWGKHQEGRLSGEIVEMIGQDKMIIKDMNNKDWEVDYKNAQIMPNVELQKGKKIRFVGEPINDKVFKADIIACWERPERPMLFGAGKKINRGHVAPPHMMPM